MEENEIQTELASIRNLMERSSKFISLSGLSGILAGIYALIGVFFANHMLFSGLRRDTYNNTYYSFDYLMDSNIGDVIIVAILILFASIITGFILTYIKASNKGQYLWGKTSRLLLFHMATPLIIGGIVIIACIFRSYFELISPLSLFFYGLALISASSYTFSDVKYLGLCEIILGALAIFLPMHGLLFWAIGFGLLHIIYGSMMYFKYDR